MFLNPTRAPYVSISFTIACVTAIGLVTGRAFLAQVAGGSISGSVRDSSGRAIAGAQVAVKNSEIAGSRHCMESIALIGGQWLTAPPRKLE